VGTIGHRCRIWHWRGGNPMQPKPKKERKGEIQDFKTLI